jgi:hypothetical protein
MHARHFAFSMILVVASACDAPPGDRARPEAARSGSRTGARKADYYGDATLLPDRASTRMREEAALAGEIEALCAVFPGVLRARASVRLTPGPRAIVVLEVEHATPAAAMDAAMDPARHVGASITAGTSGTAGTSAAAGTSGTPGTPTGSASAAGAHHRGPGAGPGLAEMTVAVVEGVLPSAHAEVVLVPAHALLTSGSEGDIGRAHAEATRGTRLADASSAARGATIAAVWLALGVTLGALLERAWARRRTASRRA